MGYDGIIALLLSIITLADASLYEFWEFKLDATVFLYLDDPKNAFASDSLAYIAIRVLAIIILAGIYFLVLAFPIRKIEFKQTYQTYSNIHDSIRWMYLCNDTWSKNMA